mgnify:CR=1 FL=1
MANPLMQTIEALAKEKGIDLEGQDIDDIIDKMSGVEDLAPHASHYHHHL